VSEEGLALRIRMLQTWPVNDVENKLPKHSKNNAVASR